MEKLIKLLNEYGEIRKYNNVGIIEWVEHTKGNLYWKYWENTWSYMVVISKEYGFIEWLVREDKINWRRCLDLWYEISVIDEEGEDIDVMRTFDSYEQLLMYLAIQDNPIEFLISILK